MKMLPEEHLDPSTSRRNFVRRCFGAGTVLSTSLSGDIRTMSTENAHRLLVTPTPDLIEYEQILGRTEWMDALGRPQSWSLVTQGFHPFSPERIVVIPPGDEHSSCIECDYGFRCGSQVRERIDAQIDGFIVEDIAFNKIHSPDYTPSGSWFPDSKRESIYWIMDVMTDHYRVRSLFEKWVVGLVRRELLGSTGGPGCGLAHQFQHGGIDIPVHCPPVDWWLFLFLEGIDWHSYNDSKIFAVIAHVGRDDQYARSCSGMLRTWALAESVLCAVDDWAQVAHMGRIEAAWYLNPITARILVDRFR